MLSRRESFVYMHIIELRLVKMRVIITITNTTNEKRIQSCIALPLLLFGNFNHTLCLSLYGSLVFVYKYLDKFVKQTIFRP